MKIFQTSRKLFAVLGVDLYQPIQTHQMNVNILIVFLIFFEMFVCSGVYFLCIANNFSEKSESFYVFYVTIINCAILLIILRQKAKLVEFIENLECFIENSEYNTHISHLTFTISSFVSIILGLNQPKSKKMYENVNRLLEKGSKIICWIAFYLLPTSCYLVPFLISFLLYFTSDLGNEVFMFKDIRIRF